MSIATTIRHINQSISQVPLPASRCRLTTPVRKPKQLQEGEVTVQCPRCKAMQTVFFAHGKMIATRKFKQTGDDIFHDCGSTAPCKQFVRKYEFELSRR